VTSLLNLKDGMGFSKYGGGHTFGALPSYYKPPSMTPRDHDVIRAIYGEGKATRRELAIAFGVSYNTVYRYTS
jgi:DNA invertase Pin-like site-specific DNA recombinase